MGSSSSKTRRSGVGDGGNNNATSSCASPASSFSSSFSSVVGDSSFSSSSRKRRSKSRGVFSSACLGSSSRAYDDSDDDDEVSDHYDDTRGTRIQRTESDSGEVKVECYRTAKVDGSDERPCVSSNADELGEWTHTSRADSMTRAGGSSSEALSGRSLNRSGRFLSRFSFVPGSVSFRLSRAASVGSSRAYPSSPTSFTNSRGEDLHGAYPRGLINRNENQHSGNLNSPCLSSASIRSHNGDSSTHLGRSAAASTLSSSLRGDHIISAQDLVDNNSEITRSDTCFPPFGSRTDLESLNRRPGDRRNDAREPVDRNVRFSRTLSVGRLRDRVLRRSSFSDLTLSPLQQDRTAASNENPVNSLVSSPYPMRSVPRSLYASQNIDVETSNPREARHHDLLEHRSNFLERRRRIRSQVRALQRLGSRFESLSGHERYCILSGQHRTGRCSCRIGTRDSNSNEDGGARASISRIVMLAEALFEVLDEIHQQSVVLSSRPSVSSIGSVPAPNEVVESLPVKVYNKSTIYQCEESAQCYICLVEYEEGDDMRILPCHHEFHKKCIDKWLKEIHRVCPLCRGDICRSDLSPVES